MRLSLLGIIVCALLGGCRHRAADNRLSRAEIAQHLMIGFPGVNTADIRLRAALREGRIGGVLLSGGNIRSSGQCRRLTASLQKLSAWPLWIAIDQEGGMVQRLPSARFLPSAEEIATYSDTDRRRIYRRMAGELKSAGINMNLAPVVDVGAGDDRSFLRRQRRLYADRADDVCRYAAGFIRAHKRARVLPVIKHFPGLGSAAGDTHFVVADVTNDYRPEELSVFRYFIHKGLAPAVLVGHVINRRFDSFPASLSRGVIQGVLRSRLSFQGMVISDDLQMAAVADLWTREERIIRALNAGVDILVFSDGFPGGEEIPPLFESLVRRAVRSGRLSVSHLRRSARRVRRIKREWAVARGE